jgi:hypothetical protein
MLRLQPGGEVLEAGRAQGQQLVDEGSAAIGELDEAHATVGARLAPRRQAATDERVEGATHRGWGEAESLGEIAGGEGLG